MFSLQLYKTLRKHQKLAEERSPMLSQGKVARFIGYFAMAFVAIYLIGFSIMFSFASMEMRTMTAYEFMYSLIPFIFTIDFYIRFAFQQTPTQQVKPYILLPLSRYSCIDFFISRQLISWGNLIWMFLYVPFAIMSIVFCEGIIVTILFLLGLYVIELITCQIYSIVRSKVNDGLIWWLLVIPLFAAIFSPGLFCEGTSFDSRLTSLIYSYGKLGEWICAGNILAWIGLLANLFVLTFINRIVQYSLVYNELSKNEKSITANTAKSMNTASRFGITGKFITLELLSIRRNKNVRKVFITTNVIVIVFSLLCSFTSVYDEMIGTQFWMIYCFALYGTSMIMRTMSFEGNYIESLLMGKRTIEQLLRAKFYIYSIILIIPLILLLPMVITGKESVITLFAIMIYTAGVDNFMFMNMIIYNKQTQPLNEKFSGKAKIENNWIIIAVEFLAFLFPIFFIKVMSIFSNEDIAFSILAIIGLAFIATHKRWILWIYRRLMERKYTNLDSMIATRTS
ncbi:MAG: DUF5687 family protein [Prevotella sp.]|nr:DUF5687 family protein [Prevotella sp.]